MKAKQAFLLATSLSDGSGGGSSSSGVSSVNGQTGTVTLTGLNILNTISGQDIQSDVIELQTAVLSSDGAFSTLTGRVTANESEISNLGASVESLDNDLDDKQDVLDELTSSATTYTIASLADNTVYNLTGAVTSLTITASAQTVSGGESIIYVTTGENITFSYPTSFKVIGSDDLSASTSYVISIANNIMVIGEVTS